MDAKILKELVDGILAIFDTQVIRIVLYGSYARGDYSEFSDIDVMLLVSLKEEEIKKISDPISDLAFDFMIQYGVDISPVIINTDHFNYWVDNLPYYRNVRDEGVRLSA